MQMIDNLQKKEILFKHLSDMSEAINLSIDSKGRINISKDFIVDKKEKSVLFVGKENIWNAESRSVCKTPRRM